ncbi:hypothetical protein GCM10020331_079670 [Ectobacillus funiculus]
MTIDKDGIQCRCGNKGCWELYASEQSLLSKANEMNLGIMNDVNLGEILLLAQKWGANSHSTTKGGWPKSWLGDY